MSNPRQEHERVAVTMPHWMSRKSGNPWPLPAKIMGRPNRLRDDDLPFYARGSRRLRNVLLQDHLHACVHPISQTIATEPNE